MNLNDIEARINEGRTIRRIDVKCLLNEVKRLEAALSAKETINKLYGLTVDTVSATKDEAIRRMEQAEIQVDRLTKERDKAVCQIGKNCENCKHWLPRGERSCGAPGENPKPCIYCLGGYFRLHGVTYPDFNLCPYCGRKLEVRE